MDESSSEVAQLEAQITKKMTKIISEIDTTRPVSPSLSVETPLDSNQNLAEQHNYQLATSYTHNKHNLQEWISLNVGGQVFTTTRTTLCTSEPNSMLARMFSQRCCSSTSSTSNSHLETTIATHQLETTATMEATSISLMPSPRDPNGAYLIDRSPKYFEPILNYLRCGKLIIDNNVNVQGVLEEAKFYGILSLLPYLEAESERMIKKEQHKQKQSQLLYDYSSDSAIGAEGSQWQMTPPLTRRDVIKALISTPADAVGLRFQGCNLAGANLSKLDLKNINFKYANLRHANLKGANLSDSDFERSDMYQTNLEGAILIGANFRYANLENSTLRAITIHETGHTVYSAEPIRFNRMFRYSANFECANLKHTNLEGSRLYRGNFHKAKLNNANLQNCRLDSSNFTGADLENSDLSGCTLIEVALTDANVKGTKYELEVS